jgi:hypothetical protein
MAVGAGNLLRTRKTKFGQEMIPALDLLVAVITAGQYRRIIPLLSLVNQPPPPASSELFSQIIQVHLTQPFGAYTGDDSLPILKFNPLRCTRTRIQTSDPF